MLLIVILASDASCCSILAFLVMFASCSQDSFFPRAQRAACQSGIIPVHLNFPFLFFLAHTHQVSLFFASSRDLLGVKTREEGERAAQHKHISARPLALSLSAALPFLLARSLNEVLIDRVELYLAAHLSSPSLSRGRFEISLSESASLTSPPAWSAISFNCASYEVGWQAMQWI